MNWFPDLQEHPGLLYVYATLLPLASFLLLLLAGAVRTALRSRYGTSGNGLYPVRTGAYVATAAIGGAFVLSLIGFILFVKDYDAAYPSPDSHGQVAEEVHDKNAHHEGHDKKADKDAKKRQEQFENHWKDSCVWARVKPIETKPSAEEPYQPATFLKLGYKIDHLSAIMFLMVTFVATLIHLYSIGYMGEELQPVVEDHQVHTNHGHLHRRGRFGRFFLFLSLFCFSMLNLVLADNLFQVFLSWELVGICSYLLIGFYFERQSAANAANKAFITNRIGDAGFIIGLLIIWTYVGSFNFEEIFHKVRVGKNDPRNTPYQLAGQVVRGEKIDAPAGNNQLRISPDGSEVVLLPLEGLVESDKIVPGKTVQPKSNPGLDDFGTMPYWLLVTAGLGIFLGCVGKSAQFPLHVWLPDAMEGPTPVSALIHAATMVAAGVYLVGRCFPLFVPESRIVIAYTGGITLFVAATIALVMTDIKKVLAYSTVSQLGYMMLALGIGGWAAGLFHLVTHAFFKALLFLGSGSVILGCHHEQEMLKMGGLYPKMKITALTMLVGVLAIAGIPTFSGWFSKDAILAQALGFVRVHRQHGLLFLLPLITAGITTFYMARMWLLTFTGKPRDEQVYHHAHETPWVMTIPLIILAVFSWVVAWGANPFNPEASFLENQIHHAQYLSVAADFGTVNEAGHSESEHTETVEHYAHEFHSLAGNLALGIVLLAIVFALMVYRFGVLDPAEAKEQFPGVHRFLSNKWYFDELYSAILVHPALAVAAWARNFDTRVIDPTVDFLARATVQLSNWNGKFDLGIIDGLVNLTGNVIFAIGLRLRRLQTGYLRSYVLFLVLAAVGFFAVLSYFVAMAAAG